MIYLLLSIISSVLLFILFKEFNKININTSQAITSNYLTASLLAYFFNDIIFDLDYLYNSSWLIPTILLGVLFIIMFNVMAITTQKLSISIAATASKMSLIIPVLLTFLIQKNFNTSLFKIIGIFIGLLSVYFIFKKDEKIKKPITIAILLFFGSGIVDASIDYIRSYLLLIDEYVLFIATIFFTAFIIGVLQIIYHKQSVKIKNILAGIVLGIPNYFSIYFVLKALENLGAITVFSSLNIGVVLISSILSALYYKENISKINWFGILLACTSILLILMF